MIRDFIWNGKTHPPIGLQTLYLPKHQGGLKLLDLPTRNKAIEATWIQPFLDLTPTRPLWAYMADALIAENITTTSGKVEKPTRLNIYIQNWTTSIATTSSLPNSIKTMIKTAKDTGVRFNAIKLSNTLKEQLPAWRHIGLTKHDYIYCKREPKHCLIYHHRTRTVSDLRKLARLHTTNTQTHHPRRNCACTMCRTIRLNTSCKNPHQCVQAAEQILAKLPSHWNPATPTHHDNLSLTRHRKRANKTAHEDHKAVLFDPTATEKTDLSRCFRMFTAPHATSQDHGKRHRFEIPGEDITAYTDGSCIHNGDENSQAGAGIYYSPHNEHNTAIRLSGPHNTNQTGEIAAIYKVSKDHAGLPAPLHIISDSRYALDGLTVNLQKWEDRGYIGIKNGEWFKAAASWLKARGATTDLQWVKGHADNPGNIGADERAGAGALLPDTNELTPVVNPHFNLTGARVSTLTQRLIYTELRNRAAAEPRATTTRTLHEARVAAHRVSGRLPTDATIWKALRHPDFTKQARIFLWKSAHGAHRIGPWWRHIPNYEDRAECQTCHTDDTLEHILTSCNAPGQRHIWALTRDLWLGKHTVWPPIDLGTILTCALAEFKDMNDKPKPGANRLYRILISEAAHTIWKLRCERVIANDNDPARWPTDRQIEQKWRRSLNNILATEQARTHTRLKSRAIKRHIVLSTWSGTLQDEAYLPDDWIGKPGVLVSNDTLEQRRKQSAPR